MKLYTADPHFDHANIIKLCKRPFKNINEMQNVLVDKWNAKVSNSDDIYILGDFTFGVSAGIDFIKRLNGTKHFITGNHDHVAMKKLVNMKATSGKGSPLDKCFFHGSMLDIKDGNQRISLCHYPVYEWNGSFKGAIHLHGHCHGNIGKSFKPNAYDVGVDLWNFEPVTLEEILND